MKILKQMTLLVCALALFQFGYSQMTPVRKFDYSILEKKTLYIPTYSASEKFISKMAKKGKKIAKNVFYLFGI